MRGMNYEMIYRSCCGGTGYRWVWAPDATPTTGPTVFRCDCGLGRAKPSVGIPLWDDFKHSARFSASQPREVEAPAPTPLPASPTPAVVDPPKPEPASLLAFTIEEVETLKTVKLTRDVESREFRDIVSRHGKPAVIHAMRDL